MKAIDKILFLKDSMRLSDKEFSKQFKIKSKLLNNWKKGLINPTKPDLIVLCNEFNLDVDDFMSSESVLTKEQLTSEKHICKMIAPNLSRSDIIFEDYAREDNSRYEERD